MFKFTYGEHKAFGRGVKCGFAKGLKSRKHKKKHNNGNHNRITTNKKTSVSRDDCWYL